MTKLNGALRVRHVFWESGGRFTCRFLVEVGDTYYESADVPFTPANDWELERCRELMELKAQIDAGPPDAEAIAMIEGQVRRQELGLGRGLGVARLTAKPIRLEAEPFDDYRAYALYGESVWQGDGCGDDGWIKLHRELTSERSLESSGRRPTIPSAVRRAVWQRDVGQCARCGSREFLEFDHIVPLSLGGSNTERNIELLCESCNRSKSNHVG